MGLVHPSGRRDVSIHPLTCGVPQEVCCEHRKYYCWCPNVGTLVDDVVTTTEGNCDEAIEPLPTACQALQQGFDSYLISCSHVCNF